MADRVLSGPDWVRTLPSNEVRFDVLATSDAATDDKLAKLSNHQASLEKKHMLQQLLADRFRLKAHIETRDKPALTLLVARSGPRMQTGEPPPPSPPGEQGPGPKPLENKVDPRGVEIDGHGATMDRLAKVLELWLRKSVIPRSHEEREARSRAQHRIILNVLVTDSSGKPVTGLRQEDFAILDNQHPRAIASFRAVNGGAVAAATHVLLMLDTINNSPGNHQ